MVTVADLTRHLPRERILDTLIRYARARRLMQALLVVEAERTTAGEPDLPPAAMAAADEALTACRQVIAPAIALAEHAITRTDMTVRLAATDHANPTQRHHLMSWIDTHRAPTAPTIDQILDHLIAELGIDDMLPTSL